MKEEMERAVNAASDAGSGNRATIARAMIGKEEGDSIEVAAPGGAKAFEILKVKYVA